MPQIQIYEPTSKQWQFINDTHKYLAYGGSRGGGKSYAVQVDAVMRCLKHKDYIALIVRKTYPELVANHIKPLTKLLKCFAPKTERFADYNDSKKEITFANGSQIIFKYCDTDKDAERFQGVQCDALYVDEATQQPEERIVKLTACVRATNDSPKAIRYTCNPGGEGHGWVKRLFIDRQFREGENPDQYAFIQSSVYDNEALMRAQPDYIQQLEALPPRLRDMWLYGNWDIYEGQFFEDFRQVPDMMAAHECGCEDDRDKLMESRRWVHVIPPFDISRGECTGWKILRSYDFGYGKPFSVGWWAIDYNGTMYRVMELYGCDPKEANVGIRWTPDQQFAEVARIEREHPWFKGRQIDGVADPSIWDKSRGESVYEAALRHGINFTKGDNNRIPGWMQCHYRLQFDPNGYPRMYVFDNCKAFIRTIPLLIYDEHKVEDLDTDLEDHVADEWRYAMMSRPIAPIKPYKTRQILFDPLNQMTKER